MCCSLSPSPLNCAHPHALTPLIEGCINIISEHFIEAANATSVNAPYGISEWALTGLHSAPCTTVKASRVKESIFSIEGKLVETKEFESRATPGKKTGVLAIVEGVRFWAREDAINEEGNLIDPGVSIPIPGSLSACCNMKE
jgi:flavin reductase (DIM6/NTAB) family NADH-FMN oxidoreductase RutF